MSSVKALFARLGTGIRRFLSQLSFRTGVVVLIFCLVFYGVSFAQMLLPISAGAKTALWVLFFGLAKTAQYMGLLIVGVEGWQRIKSWMRRRKIDVE